MCGMITAAMRAKDELLRLLPFAAAVGGGLVLRSAFPPFEGNGGAAFLAPVPIFVATRLLPPRKAAAAAFAGMLAFWTCALSWFLPLVHNGGPWPLVLLGIVGLGAWCASFSALAAFALSRFRAPWRALRAEAVQVRRQLVEAPENSPEEDAAAARLAAIRRRCGLWEALGPFAAAALWAGAECLRSRIGGGFSWYGLGSAVSGLPALRQLAALGGAPLVSAAVALLADALAGVSLRAWDVVVHSPGSTRRHFDLTLALAALLAAFWWGTARIRAVRAAESAAPRSVRVAAVDPDLPCIFDGNAEEWDEATERLVGLTRAAAAARPDFVAWPETSLWEPMPSRRMEDGLAHFTAEIGAPVFAGATLLEGPGAPPDAPVRNAYWLFGPDGASRPYAKRHLVPFGEFIPLDEHVPFLRRFAPAGVTCTPGAAPALFETAGVRISPLVCFEDTDSPTARSAARRADMLLSASNDAWFEGSCESAQHHREASLRAIECGVPLLRVSNKGASGVVSPSGAETPDGGALFVHTVPLPDRASLPPPPYARHGDWLFGYPCAALLAALAAAPRRRRKASRKAAPVSASRISPESCAS